jgi:hypothetical protein
VVADSGSLRKNVKRAVHPHQTITFYNPIARGSPTTGVDKQRSSLCQFDIAKQSMFLVSQGISHLHSTITSLPLRTSDPNTELMFSIGLGFRTQEQHRNTTSAVIDESLSKWFTAGFAVSFSQQCTCKKLVVEVGRWMFSQIVQRKIENGALESILLVFLISTFASLGRDVSLTDP